METALAGCTEVSLSTQGQQMDTSSQVMQEARGLRHRVPQLNGLHPCRDCSWWPCGDSYPAKSD